MRLVRAHQSYHHLLFSIFLFIFKILYLFLSLLVVAKCDALLHFIFILFVLPLLFLFCAVAHVIIFLLAFIII